MRKRLASPLLLLVLLGVSACDKPAEKAPVANAPAVAAPQPPAPVVMQEFLPLQTGTVRWSRQRPECRKSCASVSVEAVQFPAKPEVDEQALAALLDLANASGAGHATSLEALADSFLQQSGRHPATLKLNSRLLRQSGALLALQLDVVRESRAASVQASRFLNYDRRQQRFLSLNDIVLDGRRPAFAEAAKAAYLDWMRTAGIDTQRLFPYQETDNFTLTADGVVLKFPAETLGPRSLGLPEILLPYAALDGIIRPEWRLAGS